MMTRVLLLAFASAAFAQDWAALRTGADRTLLFRAAIELAPNLTPEQMAEARAAMRREGLRLAVLSAPSIPADPRPLLQFAKDARVEAGATEAGSLEALDRLAGEFGVKTALLTTLEKAASAGDRPIAVRLSDRELRDTAGSVARLMALYRARRPVIFTFEPAGDLTAKLLAYERLLTPVMTEHVNELGRTTAIRTMDAAPRLTAEQKEDARKRMDAAMPAHPQAKPRKARRLLVIDLQVGYPGHPSIPYANYVMRHFGAKTGAWEATFSNDLANFQYERLKQFDAVLLNNTVGMLFPDPKVRESILRFVREGGGIAGYHASTHASIDWKEFHELLGASSGAHRDQDERVTVTLDDPRSPLNASFSGEEFLSVDEHFRWSDYSRDRVRVLLRFNVSKTDLNQGSNCGICTRPDGDYAISWIRTWGKGRVFYTSLGHQPAAFMNPKILGHILAGVQYALGDLDADATPGNRPAPEAK